MESDMLAMAIKAALIISDPARLGFLAFGVFLGLVLGVIPGLGGLVGLHWHNRGVELVLCSCVLVCFVIKNWRAAENGCC